jgi:hypothetical protein
MRARRVLIAGVCAAGVAGIMSLGGSTGAVAQHEPANKVSAAGSTTEVISPNERVVLLSEIVKTSKPTDLILGVTAECSITTELTTVGNDFSEAMGQVKVWVEIDGKPVPVAKTDTQEPGRVVFCKDLYQRTTSMFDDEDATIKTLASTRNANGFNWMALNVGSATHKIEVIGSLTTNASENAQALAAVQKRTLIVEPVKSANDEEVTELG